jgi:hypothetical protein
MRQFMKDYDFRGLYRRHPQLLAYLFVILAVLLGFISINTVLQRQTKDRKTSRNVACLVLNQTRTGLKQFEFALIEASKTTPTTEPITPERRRQMDIALKQFDDLLKPSTEPINCIVFTNDPEKFLKGLSVVPSTTIPR